MNTNLKQLIGHNSIIVKSKSIFKKTLKPYFELVKFSDVNWSSSANNDQLIKSESNFFQNNVKVIGRFCVLTAVN